MLVHALRSYLRAYPVTGPVLLALVLGYLLTPFLPGWSPVAERLQWIVPGLVLLLFGEVSLRFTARMRALWQRVRDEDAEEVEAQSPQPPSTPIEQSQRQ